MSETDKVWALVHGQLDEKEAAALRAALKASPGLQREYRQIQDMDRLLRETGAQADITEDDLAKKVLRAWESSPEAGRWGAAAPEVSAPPRVLPFPGGARLWLLQPWRALRAVAALAACALILLGARNYFSPALAWRPDQVQAPQFRGTAPGDLEQVTRDMRSWTDTLRSAIGAQYEAETAGASAPSLFRKRTAWILHTRVQALPENQVSIQVQAGRPGDDSVAEEWTRVFQKEADVSGNLNAFGRQIAQDLARHPPAPGAP